jgi:hypothetical protein
MTNIDPTIASLLTLARDAARASAAECDLILRADYLSDDSSDDAANAADLAAFILNIIRFSDSDDDDAILDLASRIASDSNIDDENNNMPFCIHSFDLASECALIPSTCAHLDI